MSPDIYNPPYAAAPPSLHLIHASPSSYFCLNKLGHLNLYLFLLVFSSSRHCHRAQSRIYAFSFIHGWERWGIWIGSMGRIWSSITSISDLVSLSQLFFFFVFASCNCLKNCSLVSSLFSSSSLNHLITSNLFCLFSLTLSPFSPFFRSSNNLITWSHAFRTNVPSFGQRDTLLSCHAIFHKMR